MFSPTFNNISNHPQHPHTSIRPCQAAASELCIQIIHPQSQSSWHETFQYLYIMDGDADRD